MRKTIALSLLLCTGSALALTLETKQEIKDGESVTFKYRLLMHKGTAEEADIEKQYKEYTK